MTHDPTEMNDDENHKNQGPVWYVPGSKLALSAYAERLFQDYSGIPKDMIASHIIQVREKAWNIHPYPCIGNFRFLDFAIIESPGWSTVVQKLKSGGKFLDLGCCFAQDLRALAYEGVPTENLFGADLKLDFMDLGYELFKDKDTLRSTFLQGDIFQETSFEEIQGGVDIISARSFLHLFPPDEEFRATCRITQLLRDKKGSIVMGKQVGTTNPGLRSFSLGNRQVFRHSPETWKTFWDRIGDFTGTKWDVQAQLIELSPQQRDVMKTVEYEDISDIAWLEFVVTRL